MRRTLAFLIVAALATPSIAQDVQADALADFSAYSTFLVANDNCLDLHLDPERLKLGLESSAEAMGWTQYKRRQEASALVSAHTQELRDNPQGFCRSAEARLKEYEASVIRYR